MLRYVPSMPAFWRVFYHKWCWILSKAFSASIEIIISFLSFNLLMWCITLIYLSILKNPCIPGIKSTWSWCKIFLICCWILFDRILLRIFASVFISDISLYFSFLWHLCLVLVLRWWWPHRWLFTFYSECIRQNARMDTLKLELTYKILTASDMHMIPL